MLLDLIKTQGIRSARSYLQRAEEESRDGERSTNRFLKKSVIHNFRLAVESIEECHPKSQQVSELVTKHLEDFPEDRVLIFSEYRDTVSHLVEDLNTIPGAHVDRFIGQSKRGKRQGMTQKQQLAQLERFREGEINVLVATSVGEEGLDVPSASMVLFYEPVPSAIRAIQRRGRTARQSSGSVHVLVANNTRDVYVLQASQIKEARMHSVLGRMRDITTLTSNRVEDMSMPKFSVKTEEKTISVGEFLNSEIARYKSIEEVVPQTNDADSGSKNMDTSTTEEKKIYTRSRGQKSLFEFGSEEESDPWKPVLDGRDDINRQ
jgi:Fanconi anemia group M protein